MTTSRTPLFLAVLLLALLGAGTALVLSPQLSPGLAAASDGSHGVLVNKVVNMTCFPSPLPDPANPIITGPPPCDLGEFFGLKQADFYLGDPSGQAHVTVKDDGTATVDITLTGIAPGLTVATYLNHYFVFQVVLAPALVHPVFKPLPGFAGTEITGEPVAIAAHSVPLARTDSAYTGGLGLEPQQIVIKENGTASFKVNLDFNPLKAHQTPLRNAMVYTHQAPAPAGSIAAQPNCCPSPGFPVANRPQPVGASYVREYDPATGFQLLDPDGRPRLPRSPVPAVFISVTARIDRNTSGMHPGIGFIPSVVQGVPAISGDHIVLGIFDLRALHLPEEQFFAYVTNEGSNTVSVIDTSTNTVVATIPVGVFPIGVAITPDRTRAYVANAGSANVSVIDTATNTVFKTIAVGSRPLGVAITPNGARAYVANSGSNNVSVINTENNTVVKTIPVADTPDGVGITADGARAYVTNSHSNNVSVIDTKTNTVVHVIPVGVRPLGVAITPDGTRAYVTNFDSTGLVSPDIVSVIDTKTNTVVKTIPVGDNPAGLDITPDGARVYVANSGSGTVSVINTASNTVIRNIPVGISPSWVDITPDGTKVYVTVHGLNPLFGFPPGFEGTTVAVLDPLTDGVITLPTFVSVGTLPAGVAITPPINHRAANR